MPQNKAVKYRLSQAQLRSLDVGQRPVLDELGKTALEPNPGRRPYRFADGSQGAPAGFSIYVGPQGAFYEIRSRVGKKAVRISLGSVRELTLSKAHELAGACVRRHPCLNAPPCGAFALLLSAAADRARSPAHWMGKAVGEKPSLPRARE